MVSLFVIHTDKCNICNLTIKYIRIERIAMYISKSTLPLNHI